MTTPLEKLVALLEDVERQGTSMMELVREGRSQEPWTLYPSEYGVFDRDTRSQFYFHAHSGAAHEAGHFHTVRLFDDHTAHLVAISMADTGWPQGLFTVNLWAIGDPYDTPENLKSYARQFHIDESRGDKRLVRFVNLIFEAFLPEIEDLQDDKERAFAARRAARPGADPFEDRSFEILSRIDVDVWQRLGLPRAERRASQ